MLTQTQPLPIFRVRDTAGAARMSIAIVNYNTRDELRACLETVCLDAPAEIIVVDNASRDTSVEMVQSQFSNARLIANRANVGYGAAANQALRACASEYVLLLNSDTRLARGACAALTAYMDTHPRAAIVGPRLLNADGSLQASCYPDPTPREIFLQESTLGRATRSLRTWEHDRARVVPWVLGAALAMRRAAFEAIGGFDESFFLYWEEADLCYRLRRAGWEIHFAPVTAVFHRGGASTRQQPAMTLPLFFLSAACFYRKHFSPRDFQQLRAVVACVIAARAARDALKLPFSRGAPRALLQEKIAAYREVLAAARKGWQ